MIDREKLERDSARFSEIVRSKDGDFNILTGKKYVHSRYSPVSEAERLVESILSLDPEKTLVLFIGSGLGYQMEILEKAGFRQMAVIEKDPVIFGIYREFYSGSEKIPAVGPDDSPEKLDAILASYNIQNLKNIKTVTLRGNYDHGVYSPYEERLERLLKVKLGDFATRLHFEELWFTNILGNIRNLKKSSAVSSLFGKASGIPVIIVSAGPSLKDSLKDIRRAAPYSVIVAADTALLPLYEAEISPDFVYTLDSQIHNLGDFMMIDRKYLSGVRLVYDIVVHPSLPELFCTSGKYAANTAHIEMDTDGNPFLIQNEFADWIEKKSGVRFGNIETGGSVATSAFHFAYLLGGDPIILVGQDLAFTGRATHTVSSSHYYRVLKNCGRLRPVQSVFLDVIRRRKTRPAEPIGKKNGDLLTDFVLDNFRGWFEESASRISGNGPALLNATVKGSKIGHFREIDLGKWSSEAARSGKKIDRQKLFPADLIDFPSVDRIYPEFSKLLSFLEKLPADGSLFDRIGGSEWPFLERYFMKEKTVYDRYGREDAPVLKRKISRLIKNIKGQFHGNVRE